MLVVISAALPFSSFPIQLLITTVKIPMMVAFAYLFLGSKFRTLEIKIN